MNEQPELNNESLRARLRAARSAPALPPRFQASVWRRIESGEASDAAETAPFAWLERWIERLLWPRFALAGLALFMIAGGVTGFLSNTGVAKQQAQERYLSVVAPDLLR